MRLRERAVPLVLLCCGCAAVAAVLLAAEGEQPAGPAPAEIPPLVTSIGLRLAALGAFAWVPVGLFLMWKGIGPAKGVEGRAGLFEVVGSTGVYLIALSAFSAALGPGGPIFVRMVSVTAAGCAAAGYVWLRLKALPATFGRPGRNLLLGAVAYLPILPFLTMAGILNWLVMRGLGVEPGRHPAVEELLTGISVRETVGVCVLGAAAAPLVEEILFRGMLFGALRRKLGPLTAAFASAAIFAAIHVQPGQFLPLFVLGVALALVYEQTGSLAASVGLHAANNAVAFAAIIAARFYAAQGG